MFDFSRGTYDRGLGPLKRAILIGVALQVMVPTSKEGWMAHVRGVGELMRLSGPKVFSSGVPYKLFVGFRPLLVSEALYIRAN